MPQPASNDVYVDAALTNISVAYIQQADHFIAGNVFPRIPVIKQSGLYFSYDKDDWFRDEAEVRGDVSESAGSGYDVSSTNSYHCDVFAFHKDIGRQARANEQAPLQSERDATAFVTQRLLLRQEIAWTTEFFSTGVWANGNAAPAALWDNYTTGDPISDIEDGKVGVLQTTGFEANTLVVGYKVWRYLKHHPDIVDRYKHTSPDSITPGMVAALLEIDRILISKSVRNSAKEGATGSYDFTAGRDALLCYVNPTPAILMPSAGYNFTWSGISAGLGTDVAISTIPLPKEKGDRIEGEVAFDFKAVGTDLGHFWTGAVSS